MRQNPGMTPVTFDLAAKRREKIVLLERMMFPLSLDERMLLGIIAKEGVPTGGYPLPGFVPLSDIERFLDPELAGGEMGLWLEECLGPLEGFWLEAWLLDPPGGALFFRKGEGLACPALARRLAQLDCAKTGISGT